MGLEHLAATALIRDSHDLRHWVGFEHTILLHLALLGERLGLGLHMTQPCVSHMVSHASRTHTTHGPCMYGSCGGPWAVATYRARGTRVQAVQELAVTTELTLQRGHGFTG